MKCSCGHEFEPVRTYAHFLVCADSTKTEAFDGIPGNPKIDLTFTSPPYGQQREYKAGDFDWPGIVPAAIANCHRHGVADHQALVNLGLIHRNRRVILYWTPLLDRMDKEGAPLFGWYVWDQGSGMPGDWAGRLGPSHEFVFHFSGVERHPNKTVECKNAGEVVHGGSCGSGGGMRKADGSFGPWTGAGVPVQSHKIPDSVIRLPRAYGGVEGHPAPYPVCLAKFVIEAYSDESEIVCDPFVGSGTTIIAAHESGRRSIGIDIAPEYVAVALERLATIGLKPEVIP